MGSESARAEENVDVRTLSPVIQSYVKLVRELGGDGPNFAPVEVLPAPPQDLRGTLMEVLNPSVPRKSRKTSFLDLLNGHYAQMEELIRASDDEVVG